MTNTTVSVLCATRNRPGTLRRALESVRDQSFRDIEVLVLDDGSDAPTFEQYEALWRDLDDRFILHRIRPSGSRGAGPSQARNFGIPLAKGKYVTFLDDDDWWVDGEHLRVAVDALEQSGGDYYFANMQGVRGDQLVIPDWFPDSPDLTRGRQVAHNPPVFEVPLKAFTAVMRHHLVHPDSAVVSRTLLNAVGGFFERVVFAEDYDLMMRIADRAERILHRPDVVAHYRLPTADSISSSESRLTQTLQVVSCAQHVRATCRRPEVLDCARAREAWSLREVSGYLLAAGQRREAMIFAWQAFWTYPTAGAALKVVTALLRGVVTPSPSSIPVR